MIEFGWSCSGAEVKESHHVVRYEDVNRTYAKKTTAKNSTLALHIAQECYPGYSDDDPSSEKRSEITFPPNPEI